MKKFLSLLLLSSQVAFAGLPQEDFVVDMTRESFRDGSRPTETDLYVNFQWVCGTYRTNPGTFTGTAGITLNEIYFVKKGKDIINQSFYFPGKVPLKETENEYTSDIINSADEVTMHYYIRKNHGGLLIEKVVPASHPLVPSVVNPQFHALSYSYCLPFDFNSNAPKIMNLPWGDVWSND